MRQVLPKCHSKPQHAVNGMRYLSHLFLSIKSLQLLSDLAATRYLGAVTTQTARSFRRSLAPPPTLQSFPLRRNITPRPHSLHGRPPNLRLHPQNCPLREPNPPYLHHPDHCLNLLPNQIRCQGEDPCLQH